MAGQSIGRLYCQEIKITRGSIKYLTEWPTFDIITFIKDLLNTLI